MRIRILKNVLVEVEKTKLQEVWDKQLKKWDEINAESISKSNDVAYICTYDGDIYLNVPLDAFEELT